MGNLMKYSTKSIAIEKAHSEKMTEIIINAYKTKERGGAKEIDQFRNSIAVKGSDIYPVWKKLEKDAFNRGEIPFIEFPV